MSSGICVDCHKNTYGTNKDYYMVRDDLWRTFGVKRGMLCMTCFERRLGRETVGSDFTDVPINIMNKYVRDRKYYDADWYGEFEKVDSSTWRTIDQLHYTYFSTLKFRTKEEKIKVIRSTLETYKIKYSDYVLYLQVTERNHV